MFLDEDENSSIMSVTFQEDRTNKESKSGGEGGVGKESILAFGQKEIKLRDKGRT